MNFLKLMTYLDRFFRSDKPRIPIFQKKIWSCFHEKINIYTIIARSERVDKYNDNKIIITITIY